MRTTLNLRRSVAAREVSGSATKSLARAAASDLICDGATGKPLQEKIRNRTVALAQRSGDLLATFDEALAIHFPKHCKFIP